MSGAGKSTASKVLKEHGFFVIDCDSEARATVTRSPCIDEVRANFPAVFTDGVFERVKAAKFLFTNPQKLEQYQQIVFPYILYTILNVMNKSDAESILLDAPTLFQSGADDFCNKIIAVVADKTICVERIMKRDSISEDDALLRLNNQPGEEFFLKNADIVIKNNGSVDEFTTKIVAKF